MGCRGAMEQREKRGAGEIDILSIRKGFVASLCVNRKINKNIKWTRHMSVDVSHTYFGV